MRICTSCKRLLRADAILCPADGAAAREVETLPKDVRIGVYRIDRMLGEGGMGFVYEATHEVLDRRSAIKMLRPELTGHAHAMTRFLNEAKAVNLIDHQNIVNVYDYGDQDGNVYFVMEFLEGETLDDLMRRRRAMAMPLFLHVFGQIGRALAAAHAKQIVHRDLKPANVFVVAREADPYFIKLLDFGIAQLRGAGAVPGLTLAGSVMGTPQYMSPEQISGGAVDARSDVWALGVMMYRAATGQAPFKGEQFADLADKILHHPPRPAGEIAAVPAELSSLITSCLQRWPEHRCPSITELLAGLERVKHACRLDDDGILTAVTADAGVASRGRTPAPRDRTRDSIGGSLPRYQGARERAASLRTRPSRSQLGWYAVIAGAALALGVTGYLVRGGGTESSAAAIRPDGSAAVPPAIADLVAAGNTAEWHRRADSDLRDAITSERLQQQGFAVDAVARAHVPAAAPLLYLALGGPAEIRVRAARALGELGLPDAVPRLREALARSGDRVKIEIAAVLYRLGDRDARAILVRAIEDPAARLTAALAMAESGDATGQAILADVVATTPAGREAWRGAAGGLVKLGDARARGLLEGELAQPDAARAVGAAEVLARAGDARAREQLVRAAADKAFPRPADAALALGRLGDARALGWVADGLASQSAEERRAALGICGLLASRAAAHTPAIARLATGDPDPSVRLTAEAVLLGL